MKVVMKQLLLGTLASALFAVTSHASTPASDNAGNYAGGTWTNGANAGTGFGNWIFGSPVNSGQFLGNSTSNAGGTSGGINTSGQAWGMFANTSATADATRPFIGALSLGQSVVIDLDNGFIDNGATVGLGLQNSSSQNRIEFFFTGGQTSYTIQTASGTASGVPFTGDGLRLTFTLTGTGDTMDLTVGSLNGSNGGTNSFFSNIGLNNSGGIDRIRLFNFNAGSGGNKDAFYNNLAIVPEPSTMVLVGCGLVGAWFLRRRQT
ncbi:MAG: PEP-CTERM sorting domain-containing protein [Verrucomicrobiota bacterium]